MATDLSHLFVPESVAVVGATEDTRRLGGGTIMSFLRRHGYKGHIIPINPKHRELNGLACYPSLAAAPGPIDLAVFAVPTHVLGQALSEIPPGHVKVALVLTSGFGEVGEEGARLEAEIVRIADARGITLVGPNSVGAVNAWAGLAPTISQFFDKDAIQAGSLALVSQSGAFGTALLAQCEQEGLHFGYFVSSGNESQTEFCDFARHLIKQDNVRIVCGYLESIRNGPAFVALAQEALELGKPLIILKVGSTKAGAAAAQSHTGALVGSDDVAQAFFEAYNVVRAGDGQELLELLRVFERTPAGHGKRLAILSHSGGAGVMAADAAQIAGADIAPLPDDLVERLAGILPSFASFKNPLDMTGGASLNGKLMADCLREVLSHSAFDAALLCVNLIWREGDVLMRELDAIASDVGKPFAVSWVAPKPDVAVALRTARYPVFGDPARAARALVRRLAFDSNRRNRPFDTALSRPAALPPPSPSRLLESSEERADLLAAYGIRTPRQILATSLEEALHFRALCDAPLALKIASPEIAHRTEIGAVVTGVSDEPGVRRAYETVLAAARGHHPNARIDGVLVQEMVSGFEVLIGLKRDSVFGPIIVFGPGGILVEIIDRVAMYPAPLSRTQAEAAIGDSVLAPVLAGYRGGSPLDSEALAELLERASWIVVDYPGIQELELNPVMVLPAGRGCVAVDYKFIC